MRRRVAVLLAVLVLAGCLAACTDVPSASGPVQVESIPANPPLPTAPPVTKGLSPLQVVNEFLFYSGVPDVNHRYAREFLAEPYRSTWKDTTVTVVSETSPSYDPSVKPNGVVYLRGGQVGTLSASGVYTPAPLGTGDSGPGTSFKFTFTKTSDRDGQYEYQITNPPQGLILTVDQYNTEFSTYPLYFFDQNGQYLVPDLRASYLVGHALQLWLLAQLAAGPRPSLVDATNGDTFPAAPVGARVTVKDGPPLAVSVPGASKLPSDDRFRLAARIAQTLRSAVSSNTPMALTDEGTPLDIGSLGARFVPDQFSGTVRPSPRPEVYYLRGGRLVGADGRTVPGAVATGPALETVAVARRAQSSSLDIAGTSGGRFYVGTAASGVQSVAGVAGTTSRPSWVPGLEEVWVGAGGRLWRVSVTGVARPVDVPLEAGSVIEAVRLSPEGSRVALVVRAANGVRQLSVAGINRTAGQVRVSTLEPISPVNVDIQDVGWITPTRLLSIGDIRASTDSRFFEENVDGSGWAPPRTIGNLPDAPTYLTVVPGQTPWVSVASFTRVLKQQSQGGGWVSPGPSSPTFGAAPVYLE